MTPEERREYHRRYNEANREKRREQRRQYYLANREQILETNRQRDKANREKYREGERRWRQANPGKVRESQRRYRQANRNKIRVVEMISKHGRGISTWFAEMWEVQQGRCYLCGDPLSTTDRNLVHIDHDHTCCGPRKTCTYCRRGLACQLCNVLIGAGIDDPARMRRIADNFEPVLIATRRRIAAKPRQETISWQPKETA